MKAILLTGLLGLTHATTAGATCVPVPHAAEEQAALNAFWSMDIRLCRLPNGANNAIADRLYGVIYVDQDWLDWIAMRYGSFAVTGILAHEWAHLAQGPVGGTASELQADCLAGVFLRAMGLPEVAVEQFALVSWVEASDAEWSIDGHGTRELRVAAITRGYFGYTGQQGLDLVTLCPLSAR